MRRTSITVCPERCGAEGNPAVSRKARVTGFPSIHGKKFCQLKTFFVNYCNNQNARAKIALFASAPSSELSAAFSHRRKAAMLACALRSSSSQKSHFVAIFGSPVAANLRLNSERVNAAILIIREPQHIAAEGKTAIPQGWRVSPQIKEKNLSLSNFFL